MSDENPKTEAEIKSEHHRANLEMERGAALGRVGGPSHYVPPIREIHIYECDNGYLVSTQPPHGLHGGTSKEVLNVAADLDAVCTLVKEKLSPYEDK